MAKWVSATEKPAEGAEPKEVETLPVDGEVAAPGTEDRSPEPDAKGEPEADPSMTVEGPFTAPGAEMEMTEMRERYGGSFSRRRIGRSSGSGGGGMRRCPRYGVE